MSPVTTPHVNFNQLSLSQPMIQSGPNSSSSSNLNGVINQLSPLNSPALQPVPDSAYSSIMSNANQQDFYNNSKNASFQNQMGQMNCYTSIHPTPSSFQMNPTGQDGSITPLTLVPLTPSQLMQLSLSSQHMQLPSSSSSSQTSISVNQQNHHHQQAIIQQQQAIAQQQKLLNMEQSSSQSQASLLARPTSSMSNRPPNGKKRSRIESFDLNLVDANSMNQQPEPLDLETSNS